jgi:L-amino acid N-acyltransferase YncA
MSLTIRRCDDKDTIRRLLQQSRWGENLLMGGRIYTVADFSAYVAEDAAGTIVAFCTFAQRGTTAFMLSLDNPGGPKGTGKLLLEHLIAESRKAGARTLRALTTNDNLPALGYYQKNGFRIVAFFPGAIDIYRIVAPTLPEIGFDGIPIHDSIELEMDI